MSFESAVTFALAIFVFAITPGPGVFALLARGMSQGFRGCLPMVVGMTVSDVVYLILASFGLAALAQHWGEVFGVIRVAGAIYLFYLGWKLWRAPVALDDASSSSEIGSVWQGVLQGFLISASNPKVILFYIAFLPTFIDLGQLSASSLSLLVALAVIALLAGLSLIATSASRARRLFRSPGAQRGLNRGAGSLMIGAGAWLAAKG
ncbi:LysE family translocator [Salinicola rhizosphaerae]|uniref:Lysine transporter LysE n=1 Tax=Salinicola rhizosphaerae TaxID=1443141 RepID=A0ABQ3EB72_9GAMM|nr:LysE family translocator [Salinicola rhizosphaerae]GHB25176.1 lysine transporter LysE [Salinicola rhizosphaerae]